MNETTPAAPQMGLVARIVGVLFSPRATYAAVAARPKWFGVLGIVVLVMGGATFALLSTDIGKQIALDQQVSAIEAFGQTVTDEMYDTFEKGMERARYISPIYIIIFVPLMLTISAGILHVIFGLVGGGTGTYRQVYAIVAHSSVISALQQVFSVAMTVAAGRQAGANMSVFVPMLEDTSFIYRFLEAIDLFYVWSSVSTAIGLAVLYKRRTGPIAMILLGIYLVIALIIGYVRSGS
jgi:hypothetical protein